MSEKRERHPIRAVQVQFRQADFDQIENWRRSQSAIPSISSTVRDLVRLGLKTCADIPATKRTPAKDHAT